MAKQFWRKSILIEIVQKQNPANVIEAFTLTKPPESMEIRVSQRVSRSKTFGGVFEDDYGVDNDMISISGDTGGMNVFEVYRRSLASKIMNGKEAIYYLRDNIIKYKDKNLSTYDNYELRVYDLSAAPEDFNRKLNTANTFLYDGYVCSLDDFQITRSKDKPLFYNFKIDFFVTRPLGVKIKRSSFSLPLVDNLIQVVEKIETTLSTLNETLISLESVTSQITQGIQYASELKNQITSYVNRTADLVRYPASAAKTLLDTVKGIRNSIYDIPQNFADFFEAFGDDWIDVVESTKELVGASNYMVAKGKTPDASATATLSFSSSGSSVGSGIGQIDSQEETITVYGRTYKTVTSTTTLEKLSFESYGNPDYSKLIAEYNGITSNDEISAGDLLAIPILREIDTNIDNQIFDSQGIDAYGVDAAIGKNNEILFLNTGDFALVAGEENLVQSLNLMFSETLGARIRLTSYGILVQIGSSGETPISYIIANIKDAVIQNPRIKEMSNISVKSNADNILIAFDFVTNVGNTVEYRGAV